LAAALVAAATARSAQPAKTTPERRDLRTPATRDAALNETLDRTVGDGSEAFGHWFKRLRMLNAGVVPP